MSDLGAVKMLARGVFNRTFRANVRNELVGPIFEVRC